MVTHRKSKSGHYRYRLHVQLEDIEPLIWRTIWVESAMTLGQLHHILQAAMGWTDAHLHQFDIQGVMYSLPHPDDDEGIPMIDERRVLLKDLLSTNLEFEYLYDFGDSWRHRITVDQVEKQDQPMGAAHVEDGSGACPPEDSGGSWAYQEFLDGQKKNPRDKEVIAFLRWAGEDFDPHCFERRAANSALLRMAWNQWGSK